MHAQIISGDAPFCSDLRELIVSGALSPEAAIINATLVPDIFLLHVAARGVLASQQRGQLKTRSQHAEIVFNVGGSKHVRKRKDKPSYCNSCV